jgi:type VI secretion system protein ImpJ
MSGYRKVVWNEGMLLSPHHFQQSDNYHEALLNSRLASIIPYEWGVLELQINREAISNGYFELLNCRAVMPDGLLVDMPSNDPAPDAREIKSHFSVDTETLPVYLSVPARRLGSANFQSNGAANYLRFRQEPFLIKDETTGDNERQIAFARSNLRLLFGPEVNEGYSSIKIAELERTTTGHFALSEKFIPPALNIAASGWIVNMLRQLVEILIAKSNSLSDQRRQRATTLADFTTSEAAIFWLLHTVNSSLPTLAHLFRTRLVHPERLYSEMIELAGRLMTFSTTYHPKEIGKYDHNDLFSTFSQLFRDIKELLETVIPTRCVPIPLENTRESLYTGRIEDERLLKEAAFYIGVKAHLPDTRLIDRVPLLIKIASKDVIDAVIGSGLPGVTLAHASPPPASLPTRVGYHYFTLDRIGPFWDSINGSKTVAIYVPDEIPDEMLEMYAVKP